MTTYLSVHMPTRRTCSEVKCAFFIDFFEGAFSNFLWNDILNLEPNYVFNVQSVVIKVNAHKERKKDSRNMLMVKRKRFFYGSNMPCPPKKITFLLSGRLLHSHAQLDARPPRLKTLEAVRNTSQSSIE